MKKNNVSHMQNQKNSFKDARILTIEIIDILPTNGMSTECHGTNLKPALSKTKNTIVHKKKKERYRRVPRLSDTRYSA